MQNALLVQGLNLAPTANALNDAITNGPTRKLQNQLLETRDQDADLQFRQKDAVNDAFEVRRLLGTDPQAALSYLAQRKEKVLGRGGNTRETDAIANAIQNGNIEGASKYLDAVIDQGQRLGILGGDPGAMTIDQALRSQELDIKKGRLTFDQEKAKNELKGLQDAVDALDIPEEDKGKLKGLPADTLSKIVTQANSPKARADKAESADKAKRAEEVTNKTKNLVMELLKNRDGLKRVIGGFDELTPTLRPSSRDAEAALEDLRNLLTVENLDLMSGVLSESDIKILKSVGASGLSGSQDRVLSTLEEMDKALNGGASSVGADNGRVGRFRVRAK